jgi:BirA family transcriptional regulator, biotin operon repressor / biotin---[acetyl-CoA-carboxylase] ligase
MPLDIDAIRQALPGRAIHYFPSLDTTMREAARLGASGAPAGTIVTADEQTAGRGRHGHAWHSEPESGLYMTVILRPAETVPILTLAAGLGVREAIETPCDLRWPNDVLIGGLKCAGILLTLEAGAVLAGIGVNVNQTSFPDELAGLATSLRIATGRPHSREKILVRIANALDSHAALGKEEILRAFAQASSYVSGRRVAVESTGSSGTTAGLDENGFLLLRTDGGRVERVIAGGVRPAN